MKEEKQYKMEDEFTLQELILLVQDYGREILRNWLLIALFTLPFVAFFVYKAISTPVTYQAELTFMINEDDGGGLGGVSAILGQIGFGGGRKGKNNLNKILKLAKSRAIIQEVIFDSVKVDGNNDYLGNHLIRLHNFHDQWSEGSSELTKFLFLNSKLGAKTEKQALKILYNSIVGDKKNKGIFNTNSSDDTGIMNFSVETLNEEFSIILCKTLYDNLSKFYVTRTVEKQQQTFDVMLQKVDSVKAAMAAKEYELANFMDQNRGLYTAKAKRKELELQRDVRLLNEMYAVTLKNFEIADFSLKNKTPFIQLIDEPMIPLLAQKASKLMNLIFGLLLGIMLSFTFIILRKMYRDAMQKG